MGALGLFKREGVLAASVDDASGQFQSLVRRLETSLDDMRLQAEIYNLLEGLLPQFQMTRSRAEQVEYRQLVALTPNSDLLPDRKEIFEQVRAALRHYWGGSGISQSNLLNLQSVRRRMRADEDTPVKALRKQLAEAIDELKPQGERNMLSPEWTLYNILQLRFLENRRVRDVARRLSMSEADLYRKQRVAIEAVTDLIIQREQELRG